MRSANYQAISQSQFSLPMDLLGNWLRAYFLIKLSVNYAGIACNVRRSSDNATTNVYFDTAGRISGGSVVSAGGSYLSWAGADTIYIVSVTDQTGSGVTLTMGTAGNQPQLVLNALGGQAVRRYAGAQQLIMSSALNQNWNTAFTVHNISNTAARGILFGNQVDTPTMADASAIEKRTNNSARINWAGGNLILGSSTSFSNQAQVYSFVRDAVTPLNADYLGNTLDVSNSTVVADVPNTVAHGEGADRRSATPASAIPLTGDICGWMVKGATITNTQRIQVARSLGHLIGQNI